MIFFSIIIPTYNRANIIGRTISSVIQQGFNHWELIIVDDGSVDHTAEIVNAFADDRIRYFKIQNIERGAARNYGLQQATGMYVNYFDSDDIMNPDRLQLISEFIEQANSPSVMYSQFDYIDSSGKIVDEMKRVYASFSEDLLHNNFLAASSVFLKRTVATQFLFHEDRRLATAEDWELWLRVNTQHDFAELRRRTFSIVEHTNRSLSTISAQRIEERDLYFLKVIKENPVFEKKYGMKKTNLFMADRYTFIALTYAMVNEKTKALRFLRKSVKTSVDVLMRRRFWGTVKNLFMERRPAAS